MKYTAEGKFQNEKQAKTDLATCAYVGKWNEAKSAIACTPGDKLTPSQYWDAVRLRFLELGGEWLCNVHKPAPIDWDTPLPAQPLSTYHEPRKVRFA